jgi:uncharacterized protein (UPF0332 family)
MSLETMQSEGLLIQFSASVSQVRSIWEAGQRCMSDLKVELNSRELRLTLAYEVIFHSATLALYASGYRIAHKEESHYLTIRTMEFTLGYDNKKIAYYQRLRRKRHKDKYEGRLQVSETELLEAISEAESCFMKLREMLTENYPEIFLK